MHRGLALAGILLVGALAAAVPGIAHSEAERKEIDDRVSGDVYALSITVDEDVKLVNGSELVVKASYTGRSVDGGGSFVSSEQPIVIARPDVTFDDVATRQHGAAFVALVEEAKPKVEKAHEGTFAEFDRGFGASVNDLNDAQVALRDPATLTVDQGPDEAGLNGMQIDIQWNNDAKLPGPAPGEGSVTYHLLVAVPGAQYIDVSGHLHLSPQSAVSTSAIGHHGGFMRVGEDFQYDQRVETSQASFARQGLATLDFDGASGEHVYAHLGPSNVGTTVTSVETFGTERLYGATTPNVALGDYSIRLPNGDEYRVPDCLGVAGQSVRCPQFSISSSNGPNVIGSTLAGTYEFVVDRQAGANSEDLFAVGFEGPIE